MSTWFLAWPPRGQERNFAITPLPPKLSTWYMDGPIKIIIVVTCLSGIMEVNIYVLTKFKFSSQTYSLFTISHYLNKKRYAFSQKVSKIFIPFFYVLTVRSKGYDATTDSFQCCSKCQILHNIKLWVLSTLNVTKRFFCAAMHADHIFHTQLLPKCLKSLSTLWKYG